MSMLNIPLFDAFGAKLAYLDRAQNVISENIANADMPGYRAKEMAPADFSAVLSKTINGKQDGQTAGHTLQMAATDPKHQGVGNVTVLAKIGASRDVYEAAPNENSVILEEQMVKANKVQMDFNLMTNLMRKQVNLLYTALGRSV